MYYDLFDETNLVKLSDVSSQTLKDFIGWQVLAPDDIDIEEEDIKCYETKINSHSYVGIKIKGKMAYASGEDLEKAGRGLIQSLAVLAIKLM